MSCENKPLPSMFVTKDFDDAVIGNFMKKKYAALSAYIGKPESSYFYYSASDFKTLIGNLAEVPGAVGTRFYLATYVITGEDAIDALVNGGYSDLLTLVYSPYDVNGATIPEYFIISPLGGVISVTAQAANTLIAAYQNNKLPFLEAITKAAGIANFTETKFFSLSLDQWNGPLGFLGELDCEPADGISAFLGAYEKGYILPGTNFDISWQLTVIFELAKTVTYNGKDYTYHYDIEDTPEYPSRAILNATRGGDTIQPCPPGCN